MEVDETTRPLNATPTAPVSESQVRRPIPFPPSLARPEQDTSVYPVYSANGHPEPYYERRGHPSSRHMAPLSPRHADEDYWRSRTNHHYPRRYGHSYISRYGSEDDYHPRELNGGDYYPRSSRDPPAYSPPSRTSDDRYSDPPRERSPFPRPLRRDPRDVSPRSYPHYPREYSTFSHRDPDIERLDRFERRPPSPREFRPHYDLGPPHLHPDSPDPRYEINVEDYHETGYRLLEGRYMSSREYAIRERDPSFTFVRRSPHTRVRSMEEPREPRLPPARHLLSVSPDLMMPTRSHQRDPSIRDPIDRSHSAGERLVRPTDIDYPSQWGRRSSFHAPEDILDGMREALHRPPPDYRPLERVHSPTRHAVAEIATMEDLESRRLREAHPTTPPPNRTHGVTPVAPRTGFPSSGMRSTAPPTPPVPRITQIDSGT